MPVARETRLTRVRPLEGDRGPLGLLEPGSAAMLPWAAGPIGLGPLPGRPGGEALGGRYPGTQEGAWVLIP